jgi:acetyl esterase/lipase
MCPNIQYHKVIYIPRIKKTLTIENLKSTMDNFLNGDRKHSYTDETYEEVHPIYSSNKFTKTVKKRRSTLFFNKESNNCELMEEEERLLKLRIISPTNLDIVDEMDKLRFQPIRKIQRVKAIIIHIHGGGFVTMSSDQHQTYTRQWARDVGIPVFMISYRLSPE